MRYTSEKQVLELRTEIIKLQKEAKDIFKSQGDSWYEGKAEAFGECLGLIDGMLYVDTLEVIIHE